MENALVFKAIADETRMKIITLLLEHNYCVRALARNLSLTEATVSQHLKVLREAGVLVGQKRGYFMHYDVDRNALRALAEHIGALARIKREACTPDRGGCQKSEHQKCRAKDDRGAEDGEGCRHGDCQRHKP